MRFARMAALSILFGGIACIEGDPVGPPAIDCEADPDCNQASPCEIGRCLDNRCDYQPLPVDLDEDGDDEVVGRARIGVETFVFVLVDPL